MDSPKSRAFLGYICLALGTVLALIAGGAIPVEPSQFEAPPYLLMLIGLNVIACGGCLIAKHKSLCYLVCLSFVMVSFGILGAWVALFSTDDAISGGLFFLPRSINIILARGFFGLGTVVSLGGLWSVFRTIRYK